VELLPCNPNGANESCNIDVQSNNNIGTSLVADNIWTLYFDGSKMQDGSRAGCILIDPHKKQCILSRRLEFECTNNNFEYKALILGFKKSHQLEGRNPQGNW